MKYEHWQIPAAPEDAIKTLMDAGYPYLESRRVSSRARALDETAYAATLGVDLVITDHHECHDELPEAEAVIDCKQAGDTYPI